jgi:proteasome lid subunit RPN8/RPN11
MTSELELPRKLVNQILTHAQQHEHTESCGLVSESNGTPAHYYAVKNVAADPASRFEMEPRQQIEAMKHMREHGEELFAIVHSHPQSPPVPSTSDMHQAGYADAYYIIVSLNTRGVLEMRAFKAANHGMEPVELHFRHDD